MKNLKVILASAILATNVLGILRAQETPIQKLEDIVKTVQNQKPKRVVVAYVADSHTLEAVNNAYKLGFVIPILVNNASP